MQPQRHQWLKQWFDDYTRSFLTGDAATDSPLVLKIEHTARVCRNCCRLGRSLALSDQEMRLAETIGLLHDVGRFSQYRLYGTFNDRASANHAALGVGIIEKNGLLEKLAHADRALLVDAVRFHNAPSLPRNRSARSLRFMKLIRDADKLDIWKVFADFDRRQQAPEAAVVQHLSDSRRCSAKIVETVLQKRMANFQDMQTVSDFRLLQLSWVFDLNYPAAVHLAHQNGDLVVLARSLPDQPKVNRAVACVRAYLDSYGHTG